jgi:hypothetical protein
MRVDHDKREISLAAFLLCLLGIYAISPIDYFCRTQIGRNNRTARTCRLDDQDHQDHVFDVVGLISDSLVDHGGNGDSLHATVPEIAGLQPPVAAVAMAFPAAGSLAPFGHTLSHFGRAPPSLA